MLQPGRAFSYFIGMIIMQTPRVLGGILLALMLLWPLSAKPAQVSPEGCKRLAMLAFQVAAERDGGKTMEQELKELESVRDQIPPTVYPIFRSLVVLVHQTKGTPESIGQSVYVVCVAAQGDTSKFLPMAHRL